MLERNWRFIALRSYTAWAFYTLALVTLAPDLIFIAFGIDTNPAFWSGLSLWIIGLGILGRLVLQPNDGVLRRRMILLAIILATVFVGSKVAAQPSERDTLRVLIPLIMKWEGEHRCADDPALHCAYLDLVGVPTICFGETQGVRLGDRATDAACRDMLEHRLAADFRAGLHGYFNATTRAHRLTPYRDAAYVSLAYNVGIRGAGRSTATRRLNAGNIEGGCRAIGWWNKAGGRIVRGLVNRRTEEVALCLRGL
ncbi:GH24 family phage-related lysozyme (muramidase) [Rubricella aquisinus]|uniref:Lysozyme n=1 Tax=Rubricella aquisinus TaxID=2028108 RepID=A0A840WL12_9RHOB|nr:lysozyme [Rubricella aquisinus]MBB5515749.1 GH24 family phage-related lysozyme (muramidase) [Rubricella aquisinus]